MAYVIKILTANLRHSTMANSQEVYLGDSNSDRQSEMAAETGSTYISETTWGTVKIPQSWSATEILRHILSWWLSWCRRRSWATTTLRRKLDMRRYTRITAPLVTELLQLPVSGNGTVYSGTATSQRCWFTVQSFLFGYLGRGAVWTIVTALSRNNLTYLLIYLLTYRHTRPGEAQQVQNQGLGRQRERPKPMHKCWP